jgi:hypothetical protein
MSSNPLTVSQDQLKEFQVLQKPFYLFKEDKSTVKKTSLCDKLKRNDENFNIRILK